MEAILIALVQAVASVAPGLIAAWTGSESDEAAIKKLRDLVDGLPVRAGAEGSWARDLEERRKRIESGEATGPTTR